MTSRIGSLVLGLGLFLTSQLCQASPSYTFTDLGKSNGNYLTFDATGRIDPIGVDPLAGIRLTNGGYKITEGTAPTPLGNNDTGPRVAYLNGTMVVPNGEYYDAEGNMKFFGGANSYGSAVNHQGEFVGVANTTPSGLFYYGLGNAISFTLFGGTRPVPTPNNGLAAALSINDSGLIVGTSGNRAFLSDGKAAWDLNTLDGPGNNFLLTIATDINANGQILGLATDTKDGSVHDFLLTPNTVPEPSSLICLTLGLAAAYARTRTKMRSQRRTSDLGR